MLNEKLSPEFRPQEETLFDVSAYVVEHMVELIADDELADPRSITHGDDW